MRDLLRELKRAKKANDDLFWEFFRKSREYRETNYAEYEYWADRACDVLQDNREIDADIEKILDEAE